MINVEKIEVDVASCGHITNCYLLYNENRNGILIDPGYDENKIIEYVNKFNVKVEYIVITHAHGDHMGALEAVQKYTNSKIIVHKNDYNALLSKEENYNEMLGVKNQYLNEDDIITVYDGYLIEIDELKFEIIHTPGHTSGCICIYEINNNMLFTGDTIFSDSYGRCDLFSGDFDKMVESLKKLFERFDDVKIHPGHGEVVNIKIAKRYIRMLMAMKGIQI